MDLPSKILNVVVPPFVFLLMLLLSPLFIFFKLSRRLQSYINAENVAGKVILITGASSGIGEHLAYEYARRGARMALVARREERLRAVAEKSRRLGSPDVIVITGDVSVVEDCKRFVQGTIDHFGRLDHLVNNAGIGEVKAFESYSRISEAARVMEINFWGSVYTTHLSVPHLKRSKGKIIAVSSVSGWLSQPYMGFYGAAKAAMINFYEALRIELGHEIGITVATPGLIQTDMVTPDVLATEGWEWVPMLSATGCAKGIVDGVCRRDRNVTVPSWFNVLFWLKTLVPELMERFGRENMKKQRPKHD
ncbi:PREDICTED: 11-beta-hydroxysteroid dehydrogenase-like 4A [Tarenaya hassleriana]|uniref:11-beta-hydroxysteroid dehydrogenase-like 4A n=1 Tax=Tarenaya hassleriana TaxID=28532 RepID=UPI00053C264A|nr:PREDICTED: 11-beta-hydroxysteroid dehydrogenase-like 4A [Tarenaya hassleriana]